MDVAFLVAETLGMGLLLRAGCRSGLRDDLGQH